MQKNFVRYFLSVCSLVILSGCGGTSNESSSVVVGGLANLTLTVPYQYPAGISTTAYLTLSNNSNVSASNLIYDVPDETNYTGAVIKVEANSASKCRNIAANDSCTLKVEIGTNSNPGSFTVVAVSAAQTNKSALWNKVKTLVGLNGQKFVLTANIGLTDMPINTQSGANGISFLYSSTVATEADGSAQVSLVAVVNQNAGSFNTINLTTVSGNNLNFEVLSGNSGNGLTNLTAGSIVTFNLKIPAGASSNYSFYAQTLENGQKVSLATNANFITLANTKQGILTVQPTLFTLSASESYISQTLTYSNTGNATLNGLNIQTPQSPLMISNNNCGSELAAGKFCTVTVMSNAEIGSSGNGSIIADITGVGSVISNYTYSGGNVQNGLVLSAANNFIFSATTGNGIATTKLTLQNSGNSNESNFVVTFSPNQYFSLVHENGDTCVLSGNTITNILNSGQSCSITLKYNNNTFGAGLTMLNVGYNYDKNQLAATSQTLAYQTTQGGATLGITPTSYNYGAIVVNSGESKTQTFTATNAGPENISAIEFQAMTGDGSYFNVESGGVGGCASALPLVNGASCTFKVRFGPTATIAQLVTATLPVAYTFSSGTSSTSVSLSGYSRTSLSANVTLYNVSAIGATSGDGESANSAYSFGSSTLSSDSLVLSYKNTGATAANNFTITQSPSGYSIDSNLCNGVTLQANGGNSCTVTIKPTTSTAGTLNISLASSLFGSWSDESTNVTNHTILWDTGSGTQNTIYVNVYSPAQVTATMSKDTAGLLPLTNVKTNESFYIVLKLSGGTNVTANYTVTAPTGFLPMSGNCSISSNTPNCDVAFTAPNSPSVTNTISISGSPITTPQSFTFDVVAPTTYAYMSTGATGIFQCTVLESGGLDSCVKKANPNASPNYIVSLALDPTGKYLYALSNVGTLPTDAGNYYACNLLANAGIYESTNCGQKAFPSYGNLTFVSTQGTMYAYLAGQTTGSNGNKPNYCTINQESSLFCNVSSSYPTTTSRTLSSMVVNGGSYVYVSSITDSKVYSCDVTNSVGYNSPNCPNAAPAARAMTISAISTLQIGDISYAYVIDNNGGTAIKACQIESTGVNKGLFINDGSNDCPDANPNSIYSGSLNSSTRISTAIVDGKPYLYLFGDVAGQISICPLSSDPAAGGIIIGYDDPTQGNYCVSFSLGSAPYITTVVGSMVFGSFYAN